MQPDDLQEGMFVAVRGPKDGYRLSTKPMNYLNAVNARYEESTLCGQPFEVVAVSLPFVAARHTADELRVVPDVRVLDLVPISREFAEFFTTQEG
jgi:hypothetical protein